MHQIFLQHAIRSICLNHRAVTAIFNSRPIITIVARNIKAKQIHIVWIFWIIITIQTFAKIYPFDFNIVSDNDRQIILVQIKSVFHCMHFTSE